MKWQWRDLYFPFPFSLPFFPPPLNSCAERERRKRGWGRTVLNKTYSRGYVLEPILPDLPHLFPSRFPSLSPSSLFCPQLDNHLFMKRAPRFIPTINVSQRVSFAPLNSAVDRVRGIRDGILFIVGRGLHRPIIKVFDVGIVFKRIRRRECARNVLTSKLSS